MPPGTLPSMDLSVEERLQDLGIELPEAPAPVGSYVPYVVSDRTVYVSGQVAIWDGEIQYQGRLGDGISLADGQAAARLCGVNLIAQLRAACGGDLERVARVVKLGGFVNAAPDFVDHAKVINGASDLMTAVFGDRGRHARAAVGCASLPLGSAVEVDGIFELR